LARCQLELEKYEESVATLLELKQLRELTEEERRDIELLERRSKSKLAQQEQAMQRRMKKIKK
jgi:hypothetical protein